MKKAALGAVLVATACISVNKTVLMDRSTNPVPQDEVHVFLPRDEIPSTCQRVAILNASGDESFTDESQMIQKLREEAGKLGGNAILMGEIEDPGSGERIASALFGTTSDRDSQAEALWCPDGFRGDGGSSLQRR